ncbi:hypothetical protein BDN67DRAFT_190983 [Paxillus ammoniavirescens]|nr:hypothetical protein BDN67DRAFT_190983 [Paxillus ammoniavirescens]
MPLLVRKRVLGNPNLHGDIERLGDVDTQFKIKFGTTPHQGRDGDTQKTFFQSRVDPKTARILGQWSFSAFSPSLGESSALCTQALSTYITFIVPNPRPTSRIIFEPSQRDFTTRGKSRRDVHTYSLPAICPEISLHPGRVPVGPCSLAVCGRFRPASGQMLSVVVGVFQRTCRRVKAVFTVEEERVS